MLKVVMVVVAILAVAEEAGQAGADPHHSCSDIPFLPVHHGLSMVHLRLKVTNIVDHPGHPITILMVHHHMSEDRIVDSHHHTDRDQTSILESSSTSLVTDSVLTCPPQLKV